MTVDRLRASTMQPSFGGLLTLCVAFSCFCFSVGTASGSLRAVVVLTRHGDRTPVKVFPNTRSTWPEGLGQLTSLGMKQMYSLGQRFRAKYVDQLKLLSPTYMASEIHVRSTSKERTLMSAQSFMLGLFPPGVGPKDALPGDLQVVPVHAAPPAEDTLLYSYKNCPTLSDMTKQVRQSPEWEAMLQKTDYLRSHLSNIFGGSIRLKDMHSVNTLIRCEEIHVKEKLDGVDNSTMRKELIEANDWLYRMKFPTAEMGRLAGGNLLHEIATIFDSHTPATEQKKFAAFTLFSAHDGTILALMAAMQAKNFTLPGYANFLCFELHEIEGQYFVNIFYNDQPLHIPSCPHRCELSVFYQLGKDIRHENWFDACGIDRCTRKESVKTEEALEAEGDIPFKEQREQVAEDMWQETHYDETLRKFEWELVGMGVVAGMGISALYSFVSTRVQGYPKKKKKEQQQRGIQRHKAEGKQK